MPTKDDATTSELIQDHQAEIEAEWLARLEAAVPRGDAGSKARLRSHCQQLRSAFTNATRGGALEHIEHCARDEMRDLLGEISSSRARTGSRSALTGCATASARESALPRSRRGWHRARPRTVITRCSRRTSSAGAGSTFTLTLPRLFNPNAARWNDHDSPPDPDPQR